MSLRKRCSSIVLLAGVMVGLAACSAAASPPPETSSPTEESIPATESPTIEATDVPAEAATQEAAGASPTMRLAYIIHIDNQVFRHIGAADGSDAPGDVLVFANTAYDETNTVVLGTDHGMCVRTTAGSDWECVRSLRLINGTIMVEGPFTEGEETTFSITGGTNEYRRASGQVVVTPHGTDGMEYEFLYQIPMTRKPGDASMVDVIEHAETDSVVHLGPAEESDSMGDLLVFANPVFDADNANKIATDNGFCVRTEVGATWLCLWTLTLEDGQIMVQGLFSDVGRSQLAIVGGSGAYAQASGQMNLKALDDAGSEYSFNYELFQWHSDSEAAAFTTVEHADTDVVAHVGPAEEADSAGDVLAFGNPVYDEVNATQVGTDSGLCVRTAVGSAWECIWSLTREEGSVIVHGPFYDAGDSILAITGGTGDYSYASGEMGLHARNDAGSEYDFLYSLIP